MVVACELPAPGDGGQSRPSGSPGNITVLDWAGFGSAVSYSLDDGTSSTISEWGTLKSLGVHFTFYLVTDWNYQDAVFQEALDTGHEIGNHTKDHSCGTIAAGNQTLESHFGIKIHTMAAPNGDGSCAGPAAEFHIINRMVSSGIVLPNDNTDPFNLPSFIPSAGADTNSLSQPAEQARSQGGWAVYCIHGFTGYNDGAYQAFSIDSLVGSVEQMKSYGDVWIDSVVNIGSYWIAQKMFSQVSPSSDGDGQTWSWQLPSNFPSGKCLRVTVDGGTLSQGGQELAWDDHGYYQISLDEGSLTLSP
jgi:hypothetical protein